MTAGKKILWMFIGVILTVVLACGACLPLLFVAGSAMQGAQMTSHLPKGPGVAVVRVEGMIISGDPPISPFGSQSTAAYSGQVVRHLKRADGDSDVRAVVLRVDSPGGGVVASSEIHAQMAAMSKPVVVSMGSMAASGGYYVSAPATYIIANPDTLTGSIGVIAQFLELSELLAEYGVAATTIKSGTFKDEGSMFRPMTEAEKGIWQAIIDEAYEGFVTVVAEGRFLPAEDVKKIADGRVYTGRQALELKLVDGLGNMREAIVKASELGGIAGEPEIIEYREPFDFFSSLFQMVTPADPLANLMRLLDRDHGPVLQYLYAAP